MEQVAPGRRLEPALQRHDAPICSLASSSRAAAHWLARLGENWLNPPDAREAELKKRTLTNLDNARPTWLVTAHAALDRTVWDAYGWLAAEAPAEVAEDILLSRLLALNVERAGA